MKTFLSGCNTFWSGIKETSNWRTDQRYSYINICIKWSEECLSTFYFWTSLYFVPNHILDAFFASVYPTITSGKSTKVIIVSTPHGMNHFYRMWTDAEKSRNEYVPTDVHWSEVPGRDAVWKEQTIKTPQNNNLRLSSSVSSLDRLTL